MSKFLQNPLTIQVLLPIAVGLTVLVLAFGLRVMAESSQEYQASQTASLPAELTAHLGFAASQGGHGAAADAASQLQTLERSNVHAREALLAASAGSRSWGTEPHSALLSPTMKQTQQRGQERFGAPSDWGRFLAFLSLFGWVCGAFLWIWRGFDKAGDGQQSWCWGAFVGISLVVWLGSMSFI